jgi:hypothetical protein
VAIGIIGVIVVETFVIPPQQAEAIGCQIGGCGFNSSTLLPAIKLTIHFLFLPTRFFE